jgi:hypothetical protein
MWIIYNDSILQDDEERPTNKLDLEDAVCVIVQLDKDKFAAYYGRSNVYPNGRFVTYSGDSWERVPSHDSVTEGDNLGDDETFANPLTEWQDKNGDYSTPEYPVFIWYGAPQSVGKNILPVSLSLYEMSKEIDLSA